MNIKGVSDVRLNTKWVNYNCGVRMAGRLFVEVQITNPAGLLEWKDARNTGHWATVLNYLQTHKDEQIGLIKAFLSNISTGGDFIPQLRGPDDNHLNPIFESDSGRYVPTIILVADEVHSANKGFPHWCHLIKLFQEVPEFDVEVHPGPLFNNSVYGKSPHISCVWQLVLPSKREFLLKNRKLAFQRGHLEDVYKFNKDTCSAEHWRQIEKCIAS